MVLTQQQAVANAPLVLQEVAEPQAGVGEVRIKISACAVCRTDIHIAEGDLPLHKSPLIPGHQIVGRIDQLGPGATQWQLGQRIGIGWVQHVDGTCRYCQRERENLCPNSRYTGYDANGGFAEYAVVPEDFAHELPENIDDAEAAPLLCGGLIGYRALQRATLPYPGKGEGRLLLVGFGSAAHIVIALAQHRGHEVFVVTRSAHHLREATAMGAAWVGSDFADLPEKMDAAVLFAPSGALIPPTLEALAPGGICSIAGIHLSEIPPLQYGRHLFEERELRSVTANTREDARSFLAEAAKCGIKPQITRYPLEEANRALQEMKESQSAGTPVLIP